MLHIFRDYLFQIGDKRIFSFFFIIFVRVGGLGMGGGGLRWR